jgi:hypothetical protein
MTSPVTPSGGVAIQFPIPPSVPSYAQWQSYFQQCQPVLGYAPLNQAGGTMTGTLVMAPNVPLAMSVTTVAQLPQPSANNAGWKFVVSDGNAPIWGEQLTGGGTTVCEALSTGSQWVAS